MLAKDKANSDVLHSWNDAIPNRLTIFTFIWACQAIVHQVFYARWLYEGNPFGWILTGFIVASLLFPRSMGLFSLMLISSIVYNIGNWPFVVNHILLESVINLTILGAIATTIFKRRQAPKTDAEMRDCIFERFAPVVGAMMILMYYFILVTKLNWDFLNPDRSCNADFWLDVVDRFSFISLPTAPWVFYATLHVFLIVEIVIPLFLCFRKTRYLALIIGIPFHFLLGLIGHWTFSSFIFALYGLVSIDSVAVLLTDIKVRVGELRVKQFALAARWGLGTFSVVMTIIFMTGIYAIGTGPLAIFADGSGYRLWFLWALVIGAFFYVAMYQSYVNKDTMPTLFWSSRPGWVWIMLGVVVINGFSPYLGLKTQTSFAMYSNLRTEGGVNNHVFMPALRLANYQDDLVEIVETDHPVLKHLITKSALKDREQIERKLSLVYFEFRRIISETDPNVDFYVNYRRDDNLQLYKCCDENTPKSELSRPHPIVLAKLLRFRPVFTGEASYCQH
ncbi:MAG: hypothetical protein O6928_02310 [Gammaproteobacteria bacterium]|nr:hypothetical protein [Gammaproteobacteria bacterium]